jgi:hypothetical protein
MLNVFITVDTEITPRTPNWREVGLEADARRDLWGETSEGAFGVGYQLEVLKRYDLKGSFFVEPLLAEVAGVETLSRVVHIIEEHDQEVQLHLHTEWLAEMAHPLLGDKRGENMLDFSEGEQASLIAHGIQRLNSCGAGPICAFRAGNYGADLATLRALARNGISYDTSYNPCFLDRRKRFFCGIEAPHILVQPRQLESIIEFPISFFQDWPGHYRHAEVCAVSAEEMQRALDSAWKRGWFSFVIVSHSFELLRGRRPGERLAGDPFVVERFRRLCEFLDANRHRFTTRSFRDVQPREVPLSSEKHAPLTSSMLLTANRYREQYARRRAAAING